VLATVLVTGVLSVPYFLLFREDIAVFMLNFKDDLHSHGGNFGLKSLYAYIVLDLLQVPYPTRWFLAFTVLAGLLTTFLTFYNRNVVLHFTLWVCLFFMIYKDVWEHHYVLLMPLFSLIVCTRSISTEEIMSKRNVLFICSFLLTALPSLFVVQLALDSEGFQEPNDLQPVFVILYHSTKILGVLFLYIWSMLRLMREKTEMSRTNPSGV
jgi:hypothetical protein